MRRLKLGGKNSAFGIIGLLWLAGATVAHAATLYVSTTGGGIDSITSDGTVSNVVSGASSSNTHLEGLVFDGNGNLYAANSNKGTINKITPGGVETQFASGLGAAWGLVIDGTGTIYVSSFNLGTVTKITSGGVVSPTPFATGLNQPEGLTLDSTGNLYVSNTGNGSISKITSSGSVSTFATGLEPWGLAFDGSGYLYAANADGGISKISPAGVITPFASYFTGGNPQGLAFDGFGNLFAANNANGTVSEISPDGVVSTFASNIGGEPQYLAFPVPEPSVFGIISIAGMILLLRRPRAPFRLRIPILKT